MVEEVSWLLRMQHENLDLQKPMKLNKLKNKLEINPGIFVRNKNGILGHANLQRIGGVIELNTVVIDPDFRGEGHSHKLVYSAWERWSQDPILHGSFINSKIDFSKDPEGSFEDSFLPCKLIAFTRSASLASTLTSAGFKIAIPKRKWWNLWLIKSQLGQLKTNQLFYLLLNRSYTFLRLLGGEVIPENNERNGIIKRFFQKRRRLFHQLSHLSEYKLFILPTEMQKKDWPRKGGPNEEYYHPLEEINVATFTKEKDVDPEEITEWDSGEKEKIPYVDLAQE